MVHHCTTAVVLLPAALTHQNASRVNIVDTTVVTH